MIPTIFIYDYAYKPIEQLFIDYCVYAYLKDTYQLEDEVLTLQEELKRQAEQIEDISKKNNCDLTFKRIIEYSYSCINRFSIFNKQKYVNEIINVLKKLNKDIYIDEELIIKIGSNKNDYYNFFLNI